MRALGDTTKGIDSCTDARNLCLAAAMASGPWASSRACIGPERMNTSKKCAALLKLMLCTGRSSATT